MLSASRCPELRGEEDCCQVTGLDPEEGCTEAGPFWTIKITLATNNIVKTIREII